MSTPYSKSSSRNDTAIYDKKKNTSHLQNIAVRGEEKGGDWMKEGERVKQRTFTVDWQWGGDGQREGRVGVGWREADKGRGASGIVSTIKIKSKKLEKIYMCNTSGLLNPFWYIYSMICYVAIKYNTTKE